MKSKVALLGAFLAGGVLVGGITWEGVAHGAGMATTSAGTTSVGQSDALYTAKHAWVQSIPANTSTTLTVPAGDRLTITDALYRNVGVCSLSIDLNGASAAYPLVTAPDGTVFQGSSSTEVADQFMPVSLDSGSAVCGFATTLVGYLTPTPAA
jgi:hypothetical protein